MDKLTEHAMRMLEIEESAFRYDRTNELVHDIAEAVYDLIMRVQVMKVKIKKGTKNMTLDEAIKNAKEQADDILRQRVVKQSQSKCAEEYKQLAYWLTELKERRERDKQGEWIDEGQYADGHPHHAYRCSACGFHTVAFRVTLPKYCEECGARMKGADDEHDK